MKTNKTILVLSAALMAGTLAMAGCSAPTQAPAGGVTAGDRMDGTEHNSADAMFAQMMIPHHEQAVLMSEIMLQKSNLDPEMAKLVAKIKDAQTPEISIMESWLDGWGEPREMGHPMAMGGMLEAEDLQSLTDSQGSAAEKLFLNQMIEHHLGATKMAEEALKTGKDPKVLELSRKIINAQNAEIAHMRDLLKK